MSPLTLVSVTPAPDHAPASQWAHDIRNALAVTGLHLETLERLAGSAGAKTASAAQAVMKRAVGMCNASLVQAGREACRRRGFDLIQTVKDIAAILAPITPEGFEIRVAPQAVYMVMGDPSDVYRIIFNLVQNAVAVARNGGRMSYVSIAIVLGGQTVTVRISDDGPGLPKSIRSKLFRRQSVATTGGNGLGIAIARELAERNGAALRLAESEIGTSYVLELVAMPPLALAK